MTDRGDRIAKKLYLREYSNILRKRKNVIGLHSLKDDEAASLNDGLAKYIIVMICRNKQRLCQQAWNRWTKNTNVIHDYTKDLRSILLRKIPDDKHRSELEIEILCKWANQIGDKDPTGIAYTINNCKSKQAIVNLFQHCRLECYSSNQTILFQGSLPRIEDGHFTIIQGEVEIVCVEDGSVKLLQLQNFAKDQKWEAAKNLLANIKSLATINFPGGFGELATLSHAQRTATVRAGNYGITEVLVVPKKELMDCLNSGRGRSTGGDSGKAIDFLRQTGLASRISPKELITAADSMKKHTYLKGDILFLKGEPVKSLYLVVSGDILLDTNDSDITKHKIPFLNPEINNYYNLSSGSILGDEGLTGQDNKYESSAVVVSNAAVIFEATGYSFSFLAESIGAIRYCALAYKQLPRLSPAISIAEDINLYSNFNTLRKCIAYAKPQRGKLSKSTLEEEIFPSNNTTKDSFLENNKSKKKKNIESPKKTISKIAAENKRLAAEALANSGIKKRFTVTGEELRSLAAVPMHHALNILRIAKKKATELVKIFARDNILNGELENDSKQPSLTLRAAHESQSKLKNAIEEYQGRMREKTVGQNSDESHEELQLAEVQNIQSLLGSMAASAAVNDDDDEVVHVNRKSSVYFDDNPFLEIQVLGPEYMSLSRIEQYYIYIEYLNREEYLTRANSARPTSPGTTRPNTSDYQTNDDDGSQSTVNVVKNVSKKIVGDKLRISIEPWRPPSPSSKPHHELLVESFSRPLTKHTSPTQLNVGLLTAESLKTNTRPTTANTFMTNFLEDKDKSAMKVKDEESGPKFWRLPVPKIRHCLPLDVKGNVVSHRVTTIRAGEEHKETLTTNDDLMTNSMIDAMETSEEFWKAIKAKEFPIRKSHRPKHLWVTRAVKVGPFAKNEDFVGSEEWADKLFGKYIDVNDFNADSKRIQDNANVKEITIRNGDNESDINQSIENQFSNEDASYEVKASDSDQIFNEIDNDNDNNLKEVKDQSNEIDSENIEAEQSNSITSPNLKVDDKTNNNTNEKLDKKIKTVKEWPEKLAMSNPSSEAIEKYNDLIREDRTSRKFLEGKKKSAISSKFILPKKLSSAREIEHISSVEDMSVALLSCLLPEVEMLSTTVNLSPVKESIKKQRDEFIKPQLQFNTILTETDKILQDISITNKNVDGAISSWQQMTVGRVVNHQLGPKYTLPVLYKGKDGTINRTKRFAGTLVQLPPAKDEYILNGPTSFLELYKKNPKTTFRN